jgi:hypothetical protein
MFCRTLRLHNSLVHREKVRPETCVADGASTTERQIALPTPSPSSLFQGASWSELPYLTIRDDTRVGGPVMPGTFPRLLDVAQSYSE